MRTALPTTTPSRDPRPPTSLRLRLSSAPASGSPSPPAPALASASTPPPYNTYPRRRPQLRVDPQFEYAFLPSQYAYQRSPPLRSPLSPSHSELHTNHHAHDHAQAHPHSHSHPHLHSHPYSPPHLNCQQTPSHSHSHAHSHAQVPAHGYAHSVSMPPRRRYGTRSSSLQSDAAAPDIVLPPLSPPLLAHPLLDLDVLDIGPPSPSSDEHIHCHSYSSDSNYASKMGETMPSSAVDHPEDVPVGWPRQRRPLTDAAGFGARDKNRRLKGIAQVIARSGAASEREILQFLLSESDDEGDHEHDHGVDHLPGHDHDHGHNHDHDHDAGGGHIASHSDSDSSDSDEIEVDDDQDEDEEDEDHELRTLYRYMNPGKYGQVDLAHPLCSPIEDVFGVKRNKGFFGAGGGEFEDELLM